jgi:hypothetical protein
VLPRRILVQGNGEVVCVRHQIPLFDTLDDPIADLRRR